MAGQYFSRIMCVKSHFFWCFQHMTESKETKQALQQPEVNWDHVLEDALNHCDVSRFSLALKNGTRLCSSATFVAPVCCALPFKKTGASPNVIIGISSGPDEPMVEALMQVVFDGYICNDYRSEEPAPTAATIRQRAAAMITALVEHDKFDPNVSWTYGRHRLSTTLLHEAFVRRNAVVCRQLLERKASVDAMAARHSNKSVRELCKSCDDSAIVAIILGGCK